MGEKYEKGEKREERWNRRNESGEFRDAKGGRTKQTELIYRDVADRSPLSPSPNTLFLFLFIFLLRRTGCVSRDKIYPASFSSGDRVAGGREATNAPNCSDRMQVTLSRVRERETTLANDSCGSWNCSFRGCFQVPGYLNEWTGRYLLR